MRIYGSRRHWILIAGALLSAELASADCGNDPNIGCLHGKVMIVSVVAGKTKISAAKDMSLSITYRSTPIPLTTDADGEFSLSLLKPGTYGFTAPSGYTFVGKAPRITVRGAADTTPEGDPTKLKNRGVTLPAKPADKNKTPKIVSIKIVLRFVNPGPVSEIAFGGTGPPPFVPDVFTGETSPGATAFLYKKSDDEFQLVQKSRANAMGVFRFDHLQNIIQSASDFVITVEKAGYRDFSAAYSQAEIERQMAVGPIKLDIEKQVIALDPIGVIDREEPARRFGYLSHAIESLPLAGVRSFDTLALLAPGVAPPPQTSGGAGPGIAGGVGTAGEFAVNGLRPRDNNYMVDGADNNDEEVGVRRQGFVVPIPQSVESVSEFQIISALYDAKFGRVLSAQVNALSRTGTSSLHGGAYGYLTNQSLNARNYFDMGPQLAPITLTGANGLPVLKDNSPLTVTSPAGNSAFTRSFAGTTAGGSFDRNRTFFFFALEWDHTAASQQMNFAVPTVAQRGFMSSGATGYSGPPLPATDVSPIPFPGIRSTWYPASIPGNAIFSLFPFPNDPRGPYGANNYTEILPANQFGLLTSLKVDRDFRLGKFRNTSILRLNGSNEHSILPATEGGIDSSVAPKIKTRNAIFSVATSHPSGLQNDARISWGAARFDFDEVRDPSLLSSKYGSFTLNAPLLLNTTLPGDRNTSYVSAAKAPGLFDGLLDQNLITSAPVSTQDVTGPIGQIRMAGFSALGADVYQFPQRRDFGTLYFAESARYVAGKHSLSAGIELWRLNLNSANNQNARPQYNFFGQLSATYPGGNPTVYQHFPNVSLLAPQDLAALGLPSAVYQTFETSNSAPNSDLVLHRTEFDIFVNDEYRVLRSLVVTFGVRFNLNRLPESSDNRFATSTLGSPDVTLLQNEVQGAYTSCANQAAANPFGTSFLCNYSVSYLLNAFPPGFQNVFGGTAFNYDPRVGFNWAPGRNKKSVLRGGVGVYTGQFPAVIVEALRDLFPEYVPLRYSALPGPALLPNIANSAYMDYLLQGFPFAQRLNIAPGTLNLIQDTNPIAALATGAQYLNSGIVATQPAAGLRNPRSAQFGLTFEQELSSNYSFSLAYIGTLARHLLQISSPSGRGLIEPQLASLDSADGSPFPNADGNVAGFFKQVYLPGDSQSPSSSVDPTVYSSGANSMYHSLQTEVRGSDSRLALQFGSAFTWSHSIDNSSDFFDTAGASAQPQDSLHRSEKASSNFDVRRRWVTHFIWDSPFKAFAAHDWQLAGILTLQDGQPYTVNSDYDVNQDGTLTDRLNTTNGLLFGDSQDRSVFLRLNAPAVSLLSPVLATKVNLSCRMLTFSNNQSTIVNNCDGAIGRNTFRGGGVANLDLSISRRFTIKDRHQLMPRIEVFNALNRANFGIPIRFLEASGFGRVVSTSTPNRILQFALKYSF